MTSADNKRILSFEWVLNELGYFPDSSETEWLVPTELIMQILQVREKNMVTQDLKEKVNLQRFFLQKATLLKIPARPISHTSNLEKNEAGIAIWLDNPCNPQGSGAGYIEVALLREDQWWSKLGCIVSPAPINYEEKCKEFGKPALFAIRKRTL